MGMNDCSVHLAPSSGRCYTCHRPYCSQCGPMNGCCGRECSERRNRFSTLQKVPRKTSILPALIKAALVLLAAWIAWDHREWILAKVKELF